MFSRLFSEKRTTENGHSAFTGSQGSQNNPFQVAASYLKAVQARDFSTAYTYVSEIDQRVRDKAGYLRSQDNLDGFALELSKRLTAGIQVWAIDQKVGPDEAHLEVGHRVATGDEISPQLFDWNPNKLNALSAKEQGRLFETIDRLKNLPQKIAVEGRETFDLVRQKDGWKIFLDWPSRSRVIFKSIQPISGELEIDFLRNDFLVANNEPFQIDFTVTNKADMQSSRGLSISLNRAV